MLEPANDREELSERNALEYAHMVDFGTGPNLQLLGGHLPCQVEDARFGKS